MVRLKDAKTGSKDKQFFLFQFQYGAIKRAVVIYLHVFQKSFNSNMVRLKASLIGYFPGGMQRFNSNMVRLKASKKL